MYLRMIDYLSGFNQQEKEEYLNCLIETWVKKNKELQELAENLPNNLPEIKELKDGNYALIYDVDIWGLEEALKFLNAVSEICPNSSFIMMPGMDLMDITEEELKVINNIWNRNMEKTNV